MTVTIAKEIPVEIRRMAVARHEAAHAIVAIKLNKKLTGVILRRPDGLSGEAQFEKARRQKLKMKKNINRRMVEDAIVVLMAGNVEETQFWEGLRHIYDPYVDTQRDDFVEIDRLIDGMPLNDANRLAFRDHCRGRAAGILNTPGGKKSVLDIAQKLISNYSVTRAEIDAILQLNGV